MTSRRRAVASLVVLCAAGIGLGLGWARWFASPLARGRAAYARGDWGDASAAARQVLKQAPGNRDAVRLLARAQARRGGLAYALELFGELQPHALQAEDHVLIGTALVGLGRRDEAKAEFDKALVSDPDQPEALEALVKLGAMADRLAESTERAQRLARIPGWEVRGSLLLGMLGLEQSNPKAAVAALDRALRLDPRLKGATVPPVEARKDLARALLKTHNPAGARAQVDLVLAAGPDPEAQWLRSRAALQQGDFAAAARALEQAGEYGREHPEAPEPSPFVGAARCTGCHRDISRTQRSSHHARTIRADDGVADVILPAGPIADPHASKVVHTLKREGTRLGMTTRVGDQTRHALVTYVLGSGNRGQTFLGRDSAGNVRELRLSSYREGKPWDLTTGHTPKPEVPDDYLGRILAPDERRLCLGCHTTNEAATRERAGPEAADGGIGCERCHGPGGNHLDAIAAAFTDPAIGRPRLASPERVLALCSQCHTPRGMQISPNDPQIVRFQGITFPMSRCYTETGRGLSCVTCHDPHRDVEASAAFYNAICMDCHAPPAGAPKLGSAAGAPPHRAAALPEGARSVPCPVEPARDCVTCHMPAVSTAIGHQQRFTDHHIRIHPKTDTEGNRIEGNEGNKGR